jgi:hypothetical protein
MNESSPVRRRTVVQGHEIAKERFNDDKVQSQYAPYKEAAWGFINHWYPALFSEELPEQHVEGIQICGVPILLRRAAASSMRSRISACIAACAVGKADVFQRHLDRVLVPRVQFRP